MAPPRKRKTTVRQRRKQAARTDIAPVEIDDSQDDRRPEAVASSQAKEKRRGKAKKPIAPETWPRRELAILIGVTVVLQAAFAAPLAFYDWQTFVINFLSFNPFLLAPATWIAMLLVYKRLGVRRMRFLEAMVLAMMLFFVSNTAGNYLVGGLNTSSTSPSGKPTPSATSHPSATATASAKTSQAASPTAASSPTPTSASTAKPSPSARTACPVDNPKCSNGPTPLTTSQVEEEISAIALAMLLGIATTIWGFPTVYRWMWGPRKPRTPPTKGTAKGKR